MTVYDQTDRTPYSVFVFFATFLVIIQVLLVGEGEYFNI